MCPVNRIGSIDIPLWSRTMASTRVQVTALIDGIHPRVAIMKQTQPAKGRIAAG